VSENVDLVKRCFEAVRAWDMDSLLRIYDSDVELMPLTGTGVESGGYLGHEGVRRYFSEAREVWDVLEPVGEVFQELGDRVVVTGRCRVRGRASGAESNPVCAWDVRVRDGRIVSLRACATYEDALGAAGAEPARGAPPSR
jgi:ketosteroid isomerase-like protein